MIVRARVGLSSSTVVSENGPFEWLDWDKVGKIDGDRPDMYRTTFQIYYICSELSSVNEGSISRGIRLMPKVPVFASALPRNVGRDQGSI